MKRLRAEDYTVAWICALSVPEWQASGLLLDEEHEDVLLGSSATYQYAYGEMNGHNVVMGSLPEGQNGAGPAAAVASEMRNAFPSLRFGLLVGTGGGVPSVDHDIQLGDVVISVPNKDRRHGGVRHYDSGKAIQQDTFQHIGMMNAPPDILLSAVSKIRSASPGRSKFYEYLYHFEDFKDDTPEFSWPQQQDRLFDPSYVHPAKEYTCRRCPVGHEIKRGKPGVQPQAISTASR